MSFKSLVNVISEQRQEIKQALALFPYFETWEPDLIAECCRVSSVVEFPPDEIISGPDIGNSHEVYFILEGVCKMLRNLFVITKRGSHEKKTFYKLYKHYPLKTLDFELKNECYASKLLNQKQTKFESGSYCKKPKSSTITMFKNDEMKRSEEDPNEIYFFHREESNNETGIGDDAEPEMNNEKHDTSGIFTNREAEKKKNSEAEPPETLKSESLKELESIKIQVADELDAKKETTYKVDRHVMVLEECKKRRENTIRVIKNTTPSDKPKNTKCFFVQVGFLLKGACFGLEKLENENFILTASRVKCLKIPRGFLLQHSPCNIWNRICLFHSLHLPSKEKIFESFRSDRIWLERKKTQTAEIISLKNLPRCTSANEVPYSIRLSEANASLLI